MNLKQHAVSGARWNTSAVAVATILQALTLVLLARYLLPEDFGLMAMVMIVIGFAQFYSDAGISAAIIHRQDATAEQLSSLYWLNILAGILVFILIWILTPVVVLLFNEQRLSALIHTINFTFLIIPWGKQFEILLQRDLRFGNLAKIQSLSLVISTAVTIGAAYFGSGVWALVWGQLSLAISTTVMLVWTGLRYYRPLFHFQRRDLEGYLEFGLYQMGERSLNYFSERLDQIILGNFLGAQVLGYYNFAFNLAILPLNKINPIINKVAFPVFAAVQDDPPRLQKGYIKITKMIATINLPALIGFAAVCPLAIPLLFGNQWQSSIELTQILCVVAVFRSIGNPVGNLLLAKGRADLGFGWNFLLFLASVPAIYAGVRLGGAKGAAVALLLLQLVMQLPSYFWLIRPSIGHCGLKYIESLLRPAILCLLMVAVIWLSSFIPLAGWGMLFTQIIVGGVAYLALFWATDRAQVLEIRELAFSRISVPDNIQPLK